MRSGSPCMGRRAGDGRVRDEPNPRVDRRGSCRDRPEADGQRHAERARPRRHGQAAALATRHGKRPGSDKAASWGLSENKYRTPLGGWQGIVGRSWLVSKPDAATEAADPAAGNNGGTKASISLFDWPATSPRPDLIFLRTLRAVAAGLDALRFRDVLVVGRHAGGRRVGGALGEGCAGFAAGRLCDRRGCGRERDGEEEDAEGLHGRPPALERRGVASPLQRTTSASSASIS